MPVWKLSPNECRTLDLSNPDELLRYAKSLLAIRFEKCLCSVYLLMIRQ